MTQHTPAPWRVAFGNRLEIHGPKDEIGWPKSIVYNAGLCTDEEAQANARLIAAAPELLQALDDLESLVSGWLSDANSSSRGIPAIITARAAIAKARGVAVVE
jgi:hypothetical protein